MPPADPKKRTRTRSGCLNCRRRRRKCDETKPVCKNCLKRNEKCERGIRLNFKTENAHTLAREDCDAAVASKTNVLASNSTRSRGRAKKFKIVNVTPGIVGQHRRYSPSRIVDYASSPEHEVHSALISSPVDTPHAALEGTEAAETSPSTTLYLSGESTALCHTNERSSADAANVDTVPSPQLHLNAQASSQRHLVDSGNEQPIINIEGPSVCAGTSGRQNPTESAARNLLYLRQVQTRINEAPFTSTPYTPRGFDVSSPFSYSIDQISSDSFFEDGIFLPGSTYQELHATLRQHLIDETNSAPPSRSYSPIAQPIEPDWRVIESIPSDRSQELVDDLGENGDRTPPLELSKEEEYRLWQVWLTEISGWLDKFDNQRHFQYTLPIMAQTCNHLKYSMLAVSARQQELKHRSRPADQSLALYQEAIHILVPQLHTRSTAVIASCVVLCVMEMLSCSPKDWRRHLDGCANLMQAVGITGCCGGVEQALFWCFARMDVCGGLIDSMKTLIPVGQWMSKIDLAGDIALFQTATSFDMYANYAVYLCAQVVDLLSDCRDRTVILESRSYLDKWTKLWRYIQSWRLARPPEMQSVISIPKVFLTPFPTTLFSNPAAISGNQLYHTASILMLQNKPPSARLEPKPRPIQWHARQICGISLSHDHHGAWTNSVQPLWIAGRCMRQPEEQRAILDHLYKIETESGWGTRWRMQDLKEFWEIEYGPIDM